MKHFVDIATDSNGNGIQGASVSVYVDSGHSVLATLYSDDGVTQEANPVTTAANGWFDFFIADGHYWFVISKAGYPTVYLDDIVIQDSPTNNIVIGAQAPRQVSGGPERLSFQSPAVNQCCIATFVTTDTTQNARLLIDMQGDFEWGGPNQTDQDVLLGWSQPGRLNLDGASGGGFNIVRWSSPGVEENQPRILLNNDGSGIQFTDGTNPSQASIFLPATGQLSIQANKVGISTSSPAYTFDVAKDLGTSDVTIARFKNTNATLGGTGVSIERTNNARAAQVVFDGTWYAGILRNGGGQTTKFAIQSSNDLNTGAREFVITGGCVGIGTATPHSKLAVVGLPVYANNAAAIAGGLAAGDFYRTGGDPDLVCVVH